MPLPPPELPEVDPARAGAMVGVPSGPGMGGIPEYLGIRNVEATPGLFVAEVDVREDLLNPFGALHGGVLSAVADHVLGAVVYTVVERGYWAATTEFKINFLAPVRTGQVRAEAAIISLSRRTAVVRIDMVNEGRAVAAAQGTVTIVAPRT
ncbi:MAG TPA: PaaI family thioesterase [Acidimicrobiales bacterium]|nr:PaaI family thioesterase [Acidimicrobiales bacterium]